MFMVQIGTNDFRAGMKIEVDGQPYTIVSVQFVKPGKGQAFTRVKLKHLMSGRTIERTFKSGETVEEADVKETKMRLLYTDSEGGTFMDDDSYEQLTLTPEQIEDVRQWLQEDVIYSLVFYKGQATTVEPPTFMELEITETAPGVRGDTASGRVLKPATLSTGSVVQVPIFIEQGEIIKVDTRTGEYVSRVNK
jgi:elongation factor P